MDAYQKLANAIVELAAKDYRSSLKALKRNPRNRDAMERAMECERFFKSDWMAALTDVDGEWLMERLREEARKL